MTDYSHSPDPTSLEMRVKEIEDILIDHFKQTGDWMLDKQAKLEWLERKSDGQDHLIEQLQNGIDKCFERIKKLENNLNSMDGLKEIWLAINELRGITYSRRFRSWLQK